MPEPGGPSKYLTDQLILFQPGGGQIITTYCYWGPHFFHLSASLNARNNPYPAPDLKSETYFETTNLIVLLLQFIG